MLSSFGRRARHTAYTSPPFFFGCHSLAVNLRNLFGLLGVTRVVVVAVTRSHSLIVVYKCQFSKKKNEKVNKKNTTGRCVSGLFCRRWELWAEEVAVVEAPVQESAIEDL